MRIGLVGGTGKMGEGLALRWCPNHDIIIGSRDVNKASNAANDYLKKALEYYGSIKGRIKGEDNSKLVSYCDVVSLCIPYENAERTLESIAPSMKDDSIVICPIVPMSKGNDSFIYLPMHEHRESAAEMVSKKLSNARVVSALHTISDVKLRRLNTTIDTDVLICANDKHAASIVTDLIREIRNLRPVYVGSIDISYQVEAITPMLLNIAKQNSIKNPGIKII